jgi:hypothetical protein
VHESDSEEFARKWSDVIEVCAITLRSQFWELRVQRFCWRSFSGAKGLMVNLLYFHQHTGSSC